jgi:SAM-dependent methyltransferase
MTSAVLNVGCGRKKLPGAVNLDITTATDPDVVHDLNVRPWPFPDSRFAEVHANDVIEHLDNLLGVMDELHRVCRHGARIQITVPHFSSPNAFTDPTHRHYFGWFSFDYFTGEHEHNYYTRSRFHMAKRRMIFHPTLSNKLVHRLANRYPARYERAWAWSFPAWFLSFELEVIKEGSP